MGRKRKSVSKAATPALPATKAPKAAKPKAAKIANAMKVGKGKKGKGKKASSPAVEVVQPQAADKAIIKPAQITLPAGGAVKFETVAIDSPSFKGEVAQVKQKGVSVLAECGNGEKLVVDRKKGLIGCKVEDP